MSRAARGHRGAERAWIVVGVASCAIALFLGALAVNGATTIGIQNDEPNHQQRTANWFETGWYLPNGLMDGDRPREDVTSGRIHAYGAGFSLFGHGVAVLTGAEEYGEPNRTAAAYEARHLALVAVGIAGAIAVGYALAVTLGSWAVGAFAAAALLASPLWTGYSMFAIKDIPAGAGWTFVTVAAILGLRPAGIPTRLLIAALCALGVWFTAGVRTALWVPVLASVGTFGILVLVSRVRDRLWGNLIAVGGGVVAGFVAMALAHRNNAATPVRWFVDAVSTSGDFHWTGTTLTAGLLLPEKPPWWYLPAWGLGSVPLLLGLLAVVGLGAVAVLIVRRAPTDLGPVRRFLAGEDAGWLLWVQQALLLPIVATVGGATMYAGFRHHLYVLPSLAALGALAAHVLVDRLPGQRRAVSLTVAVLLVVALVVPAVEQTRLFPYGFVYKNVIAGPVEDRWETDMHFVSGREAVTRVPGGVEAHCYSASVRRAGGEIVSPPMRACENQPQIAPFLDAQGTHPDVGEDPGDGRVWVVGRRYRGSPPAPNCDEAATVERPLRGERLTISYVLLCDPEVLD